MPSESPYRYTTYHLLLVNMLVHAWLSWHVWHLDPTATLPIYAHEPLDLVQIHLPFLQRVHFQASPMWAVCLAPRPLWVVIGPSSAKRETSGVSKFHRTHRILLARPPIVWPAIRGLLVQRSYFDTHHECRSSLSVGTTHGAVGFFQVRRLTRRSGLPTYGGGPGKNTSKHSPERTGGCR